MTQKELIKSVADNSGLTQADVERVLKALSGEILRAVTDGDKVVIPNVGSFTRTFRQARTAKGGFGEYSVAARWTPRFKPVRAFKEAVNSNGDGK